jgi:Rod binding domain-containing protein
LSAANAPHGKRLFRRLAQALSAALSGSGSGLLLLLCLQLAAIGTTPPPLTTAIADQRESAASKPEPETPETRTEQEALKQRRQAALRLVAGHVPARVAPSVFPQPLPTALLICARSAILRHQHRPLPSGDPSRRLQRSHAPPGMMRLPV